MKPDIKPLVNSVDPDQLVQGQVNRNFQLVQNEIGPGQTKRA